MSPISTIVHLTLFEARRRRVLTAAVVAGSAFLAVFSIGLFFANAEMIRDASPFLERQAVLTTLTLAGLYATNFLSVLLAVLLPVDALSGEIDSGVIQTVAAKPIRRADIVLGKWLGYGLLITAYLVLLSAGVLLVSRLVVGHLHLYVMRGLPLMLLEVFLLLTVSIAGGTRLSTVANGILSLGVYGLAFIGGWVEQIGGFAGLRSARNIGIAVSLLSPPDALWRMAAYHMQPAFVRDALNGPAFFWTASVPNMLMVWWAVGFVVVTLAWSVRSFERRAL
jgi:ABC-2 type transport system permease protein